MLLKIRKFKVTKKVCVTKSLCKVWLAPCDGERIFNFRAGQFVMVHELDKDGNSVYVRSYSIASPPVESEGDLELGIRVQGKMSGMLYDAEVGDIFGVQGPFGMFSMPSDERVVFFSGGVGITPFRAMIRDAISRGAKTQMILFHSGKSENDLLYHDEYTQMAKDYPNFIYVPIITREISADWVGESRRLDEAMMDKYINQYQDACYLMCGPHDMMDSVKQILEKKGVEIKTKLRAEIY